MELLRFFSFEPRTGRTRWAAWFALTLGSVALAIFSLRWVEGLGLVGGFALLGLAAAKLAAESVRRLHDCGQRAWLVVASGPPMVVVFFAWLSWLARGASAMFFVLHALSAMAIAILFLRRGMRSVNAYGPPPHRFASSGPGGGKAGISLAVAFFCLGIILGLALLRWNDALARAHAEQLRGAETYVEPADPFSNERHAQEDPALDPESAAALNRIDAMLNAEAPK